MLFTEQHLENCKIFIYVVFLSFIVTRKIGETKLSRVRLLVYPRNVLTPSANHTVSDKENIKQGVSH